MMCLLSISISIYHFDSVSDNYRNAIMQWGILWNSVSLELAWSTDFNTSVFLESAIRES